MPDEKAVAFRIGPVVRPVCVFFLAVAAMLCLTGLAHRTLPTIHLAGLIVLTGSLVVMEVARRLGDLHLGWGRCHHRARQTEQHMVEVLRRIVEFVEARDKFSSGHSLRVASLARQIGKHMQIPRGELDRLELAGRLHDIGMVAVPREVLAQKRRLDREGLHRVREHPVIAHDVLTPLSSLVDVLPAIRHHHERMNGTGYPDGLAGEAIPLTARILAVADAYDAMTHDRPYRPAMSSFQAMEELRRCSPAGFDPACVEALAELKHIDAMGPAMRMSEAEA